MRERDGDRVTTNVRGIKRGRVKSQEKRQERGERMKTTVNPKGDAVQSCSFK